MAGEYSSERRRVLRLLRNAARAAVAFDLLAAAGCSGGSAGAPAISTIALEDVPLGGRVQILHRGLPLELRRTATDVAARLLQCTHMGCEVRWDEARREYDCPCHGAVFDADGNVMLGPPTRPLDSYPVRVEGDSIVLEG